MPQICSASVHWQFKKGKKGIKLRLANKAFQLMALDAAADFRRYFYFLLKRQFLDSGKFPLFLYFFFNGDNHFHKKIPQFFYGNS
jgi:hypothetical protein